MNLPDQSAPVYRYGMPAGVLVDGINPSACGGYSTCATMNCTTTTCTVKALGQTRTFDNPFNGKPAGTGECCANIFTKKGCCCLAGQTVCNQ